MSEFLIITSTFAREPMLAIILAAGLLIGIGALVLRVQSIAFGEPSESRGTIQASYVPFFIHLVLVLAAGLYLPGALVSWFQTVATLIG
jgi:hydrogenase-4 component F